MNLISILLGLASLTFAIHALQVRGCLICCTCSLFTCGLALVLQLGELYRLSLLADTAAIFDTLHARLLAGCCLLGLNAGLHLLALLRGRRSSCENCG